MIVTLGSPVKIWKVCIQHGLSLGGKDMILGCKIEEEEEEEAEEGEKKKHIAF